MKPVRIWFEKKDAARYISHLDLNRCISRAIHQARIPLWYTEGFNPHAFLTFALPLPLGVQGDRESFDIRLESEMEESELISRLNRSLPEGIRVFAAKDPQMKPGKIAYAFYRIELEPDEEGAGEFCQKLQGLFGRDEIPMEKKTKSGVKQVNLKRYLGETQVKEEDGKVVIEAMLPAGSEENVSPLLLTGAVEAYLTPNYSAFVERKNLFDAEKKEFA